jgi:uncharacterized protein
MITIKVYPNINGTNRRRKSSRSMITIKVYRNINGEIYGFDANNHGEPMVCAAVSALVINTANSIEALTTETIVCDYKEKGGYLSFSIENIKSCNQNKDVKLLLDSLLLGLNGIMLEYKQHLKIIDKEVL